MFISLIIEVLPSGLVRFRLTVFIPFIFVPVIPVFVFIRLKKFENKKGEVFFRPFLPRGTKLRCDFAGLVTPCTLKATANFQCLLPFHSIGIFITWLGWRLSHGAWPQVKKEG